MAYISSFSRSVIVNNLFDWKKNYARQRHIDSPTPVRIIRAAVEMKAAAAAVICGCCSNVSVAAPPANVSLTPSKRFPHPQQTFPPVSSKCFYRPPANVTSAPSANVSIPHQQTFPHHHQQTFSPLPTANVSTTHQQTFPPPNSKSFLHTTNKRFRHTINKRFHRPPANVSTVHQQTFPPSQQQTLPQLTSKRLRLLPTLPLLPLSDAHAHSHTHTLKHTHTPDKHTLTHCTITRPWRHLPPLHHH